MESSQIFVNEELKEIKTECTSQKGGGSREEAVLEEHTSGKRTGFMIKEIYHGVI